MGNDKELLALKALAQATTPGQWRAKQYHVIADETEDRLGFNLTTKGVNGNMGDWRKLAAYIAAANPTATLSLIDRVEQQAARIEELTATLALRTAEYEDAHADRLNYAARIAELESAQPSPATVDSRLDDDLIISLDCLRFTRDGDDCAIATSSVIEFARAIEREVVATRATVDLSGLTRYEPTKVYLGDGDYSYALLQHPDGEYVKLAEVQALLATTKGAEGDGGKIEEIRALLSEAYQFKSTSKGAQENNNAALDLLDGLATPSTAAQAGVRDVALEEAARAVEQCYTGLGGPPDDPHPDAVLVNGTVSDCTKAIRALKTKPAPVPRETDRGAAS